LDVIRDPLHATTLAEVLAQLRDLIDYTLTSRAELLKDFPADNDDYAVILEALKVLRLTAASISLDKLLEEDRRESLFPSAVRRAGDGSARIDIRGGDNCSTDEILRHQHGR
jgi:hypothetical protein